jgi:hypothetical protein
MMTLATFRTHKMIFCGFCVFESTPFGGLFKDLLMGALAIASTTTRANNARRQQTFGNRP